MRFFGTANVTGFILVYAEAETKEEAEQKMIDFATNHVWLGEDHEIEIDHIARWEKSIPILKAENGWHNVDSPSEEQTETING